MTRCVVCRSERPPLDMFKTPEGYSVCGLDGVKFFYEQARDKANDNARIHRAWSGERW